MAKETQHTPGPWVVNQYNISTKDGDGIAAFVEDSHPDKANARLIAAAPELLEAAEALLHNMANMHDVAQEMTNLEAAIAKARGRS